LILRPSICSSILAFPSSFYLVKLAGIGTLTFSSAPQASRNLPGAAGPPVSLKHPVPDRYQIQRGAVLCSVPFLMQSKTYAKQRLRRYSSGHAVFDPGDGTNLSDRLPV
jgi:hypothetical protein